MFPPLTIFAGHLCWFGPGIVFFLLGLSWTIHFIKDRRYAQPQQGAQAEQHMQIAIVGFGYLLLGSLFTCAFLGASNHYMKVRFDPTTVKAMQITRIADENSEPQGPSLIITDRQLLSSGLSLLTQAVGNRRQRGELYTDGYSISLLLDNETTYGQHILQVFRHSNYTDQPIAVVRMSGWEYESPAFHQWIETTIDPLFQTTIAP